MREDRSGYELIVKLLHQSETNEATLSSVENWWIWIEDRIGSIIIRRNLHGNHFTSRAPMKYWRPITNKYIPTWNNLWREISPKAFDRWRRGKTTRRRTVASNWFHAHSRELHAFLYDAVVLDYLSGQDDGCRLRVVGNWYAMTGYGIGFPKQSKFKDMINKELIEMHHSGKPERSPRDKKLCCFV